MSFNYDGSNVPESGGWLVSEPGEKCLRIKDTKEGISKKGFPQVVVDFVIIGGRDDGKEVRYHRVTFMPASEKGAGMAVHFLKSIGEPVKGNFQAAKWIGRYVKGFVKQESYNGQTNNTVAWVDEWKEPIPPSQANNEDFVKVPF